MSEEIDYKTDYKTAYENVMIANKMLEQENKRLNTIINNIANYIDRMSYASIVDNPRQDLTKILKKDNNYEN